MYKIDLNCDLGESYGAYVIGSDNEILEFISSANIACGFHGGDPTTMHKTVKLCLANKVSIGAHPGLPDLLGFGRRVMAISPMEAYDMMVYQIGALSAFVNAEGGKLMHVKPHGALYHLANKDEEISNAIVEAVYKVDPELIVYGMAGSKLIEACHKVGIRCGKEAFADRTYMESNILTPRSHPEALITTPDKAAEQALNMVKSGYVITISGEKCFVEPDTICIHGDGDQALSYARKIRELFDTEKVLVQSMK